MTYNYKLVTDAKTQEFIGVVRLSDGVPNAGIPLDPANTDYQRYLEWLAENNEPLPADEPTV